MNLNISQRPGIYNNITKNSNSPKMINTQRSNITSQEPEEEIINGRSEMGKQSDYNEQFPDMKNKKSKILKKDGSIYSSQVFEGNKYKNRIFDLKEAPKGNLQQVSSS